MITDDLMPPARTKRQPPRRRAPGEWLTSAEWMAKLRWIDGTPLVIERYRQRIFTRFLDERDIKGRLKYNLGLAGRGKKNWKSADLTLMALFALLANDSPSGNECYLLAADEGQAADDLSLAKKLLQANQRLADKVRVTKKIIDRRDGYGFLEILPAKDVSGTHGKGYRFAGLDEVHTQTSWDLLEALQLDPTRLDAQMMVTSYASLHHRPGVPLYDLMLKGKTFADPRFFFSWYGADFCNDPEFISKTPEEKANPSKPSWPDQDYLEQQKRRLPSAKYRRLHLNLPGLPEGAAFSVEGVTNAIARGVQVRPPEPGKSYVAFVDMSGGSADDACLGIAHTDANERAVLDVIMNQGQSPPFDPMVAVDRFVATLKEYGITRVTGDKYAGETFKSAFEKAGVSYTVSDKTKSDIYASLEPVLNSNRCLLLDHQTCEEQALSLIWRGGRIDHPQGEHDDFINAAAGAVMLAIGKSSSFVLDMTETARLINDARRASREQAATGVLGRRIPYGSVHPHEIDEPAPLMRLRSRDAWLWGGR